MQRMFDGAGLTAYLQFFFPKTRNLFFWSLTANKKNWKRSAIGNRRGTRFEKMCQEVSEKFGIANKVFWDFLGCKKNFGPLQYLAMHSHFRTIKKQLVHFGAGKKNFLNGVRFEKASLLSLIMKKQNNSCVEFCKNLRRIAEFLTISPS